MCKKSPEGNESAIQQAPERYTVTAGYLSLKDESEFDSLFQAVDAMDEAQLDNWEQSLTGFTSHRKYYDNIDALYSPNCTITVAADTFSRPEISHVMAAMVNGGGFIKIGDTLYKFGDPIAQVYYNGVFVRSYVWKHRGTGSSLGSFSSGNQSLICVTTANFGKGHKDHVTINGSNRFKCDVTHWLMPTARWIESSMVREQYDRYWFFGWQYRWKNVRDKELKIVYDLKTTYSCPNNNLVSNCPSSSKTASNESRLHRTYNQVINMIGCSAYAYTENVSITYSVKDANNQTYSITKTW